MKKRNAKNVSATSAETLPTIEVSEAVETVENANEIATSEVIEATSEATSEASESEASEAKSDETTIKELREQAKQLREQAISESPNLEAIDATKLDATKLKALSKQIADCEKLEKQAEKLEKQANAMAKANAKAILALQKANETKESEKFLVVCEEIAKAEREFVTLQNANDKMHQAAIWAFNALTDTDFLIDREAHAETIATFESISQQLDASNELTSNLAKQAQDRMRALYIANVEAVASSQMKKARKAIGVKANEQMEAIVASEATSEASDEATSEAIAA